MLETAHGNLDLGLALFDSTITAFHQTGNVGTLLFVLTDLAVGLDRLERPVAAATLCGAIKRGRASESDRRIPGLVDHLRTVLGGTHFEACVATGAAMDLAEAVRYARLQIQLVRSEMVGS